MAVWPAALVSDEKRIRSVYARCAIQIDTFIFYLLPYRPIRARDKILCSLQDFTLCSVRRRIGSY